MKKALFLLLSVIFINASCKNNENKSNKIAGKWKIVEMNINDMSDTEKKEVIDKALLEFTNDEKFIATTMDNETSQGTFTYDEKEKTLVVINNAGGRKDSQKFSIAWEGGLLLMTNDDGVVKLKRQ